MKRNGALQTKYCPTRKAEKSDRGASKAVTIVILSETEIAMQIKRSAKQSANERCAQVKISNDSAMIRNRNRNANKAKRKAKCQRAVGTSENKQRQRDERAKAKHRAWKSGVKGNRYSKQRRPKESKAIDKAIGRNKRGKSKAAAFVRLRQEEHK